MTTKNGKVSTDVEKKSLADLEAAFEQAENGVESLFLRLDAILARLAEIDKTPAPADDKQRQQLFLERAMLHSEREHIPAQAALASAERTRIHIALLAARIEANRRESDRLFVEHYLPAAVKAAQAELDYKHFRIVGRYRGLIGQQLSDFERKQKEILDSALHERSEASQARRRAEAGWTAAVDQLKNLYGLTAGQAGEAELVERAVSRFVRETEGEVAPFTRSRPPARKPAGVSVN